MIFRHPFVVNFLYITQIIIFSALRHEKTEVFYANRSHFRIFTSSVQPVPHQMKFSDMHLNQPRIFSL